MIINYVNAVVFGIIQGITEFLPISSSGHLVILHKFISLPIQDELTFDIILHIATLIAVIWFFRKDVWRLLKAWITSLVYITRFLYYYIYTIIRPNNKNKISESRRDSFFGKIDMDTKLSWFIVLATIPAVLAGLFLENMIENIFRSPIVVVIMLIVVGALFIVFEKISRKIGELSNLNWQRSLFIGLAQAISLIPGTSRSGITIIAGLGAGLKREAAIKFSFLLSIPIIFGASIKKIPNSFEMPLPGEALILLISFIASITTGFFAIKYFLQFSRRFSLNIFAYYRFILAILILIFLVL